MMLALFYFTFHGEETFTRLPSPTPSGHSRRNSVEFVSVLFWTQLKHPPALEEKQLLEHFASKQ